MTPGNIVFLRALCNKTDWMQFFRGAPTGNRADLAGDAVFMSDTAIDFNLTGWTGRGIEQRMSADYTLSRGELMTIIASLQV